MAMALWLWQPLAMASRNPLHSRSSRRVVLNPAPNEVTQYAACPKEISI